MKSLSQELDKFKANSIERDNKLCHFIATNDGYKPLDPPRFAKDIVCHACGNSDYALWMLDAEKRAWMCGLICAGSKLPKSVDGGYIPPTLKRALLWPLFCEINGIGDLHHGVKFENIHQTKGKLDFLLEFGTKPCGIALMQGDTGTGKTYAAMGVCELFTRTNTSCIFATHKQMLDSWLETFKPADRFNNYVEKVMTANLLVVDDFGTGEISPSFLSFFMDLINTRMQWSNRGTIITSNLERQKFGDACGDALSDRLRTGQLLVFNDTSRRFKAPL